MGGHSFIGTEAVACGALTQRQLRKRYTRIYRNIYRDDGPQFSAGDRAVAAWLWSGMSSVVAGNSAAALHGAEWVDASLPAELITTRKHAPPLIITRNETLLRGETTVLAGIPVTTPARTAFDVGRRPPLVTALQRLDALARATRVATADITPLMEAHRGLRGMKQLRRTLPLIDPRAESPQETSTRLVLIDGGLPTPQTQIVVRDEWGVIVARIDMGWENWHVGVEFDGAQHWTDPSQRAKDIDRAAELSRLGWVIIRVSYDLLRNRPEVLLARVRQALRAAGCQIS